MTFTDDRRKFSRLEITEAAVAVDESGFKLGRVSEASGGGMKIEAASMEAMQRMKLGTRMVVTVVEPGNATTNSFNVEVRYSSAMVVGMEFV